MKTKNKFLVLLLPAILVALMIAGLPRFHPTSQANGQNGPSEQPVGQTGGKGSHEKDIAAIKKSMQNFIDAFEKGDAKAVAAFWTPEGEYIADDGTKYQGREELEKAYAEFFAKNKNVKV